MRRWPACCDTQVVQEQEPLLVQPSCEDGKHQLLEVFRPVRRSKGQTLWQIGSRRNEHGHLLSCVLLVVALVETFLEVSHRNEFVTRDSRFDLIAVRNQEQLPNCDLIQLPIIDHEAASSLDSLVGWGLLSRERREPPRRVALH